MNVTKAFTKMASCTASPVEDAGLHRQWAHYCAEVHLPFTNCPASGILLELQNWFWERYPEMYFQTRQFGGCYITYNRVASCLVSPDLLSITIKFLSFGDPLTPLTMWLLQDTVITLFKLALSSPVQLQVWSLATYDNMPGATLGRKEAQPSCQGHADC